MSNNDNNLYSIEEQEDLLKYKKIRNDIIDTMVKDGIKDNRDRRMINELISAAESSIHTAVSNKLKHQDNLNKDAIAETIAGLLRSTKSIQDNSYNIEDIRDPNLDEHIIPVDIVPGELEITPPPLDPKDFESPIVNDLD